MLRLVVVVVLAVKELLPLLPLLFHVPIEGDSNPLTTPELVFGTPVGSSPSGVVVTDSLPIEVAPADAVPALESVGTLTILWLDHSVKVNHKVLTNICRQAHDRHAV